MKTRTIELAAAALILTLSGATRAADAGPAGAQAADAGAQASSSGAPAAAPPPSGMPAGHGSFGMPDDAVVDDDKLPEGTIAITVLDESERPKPQFPVTLGVLQNSVAKGESRKKLAGMTDELGVARFDGLSTATDMAYRVSALRDGASYAAMPFNLPQGHGIRVRLRTYPATSKLPVGQVEMQGVLYVDLKDDRVQIEELFTVMNVGRTAWVPDDFILPLPADFQALRAQQGMNDIAVDPVEGKGARVRGTFGPGRNDIEFSWQVPYHGGERVDLTVGMPPEVSMFRVLAAAAPKMKLAVEGFPEAVARTDQQCQHVLVTERHLKDEEELGSVHVAITDIPSQGPAPTYVTLASAALVLLSVGFASRKKDGRSLDTSDPKKARARLLAELEDLERAKLDGDVGPKTYEKARRDILSGIARTLAYGDAGAPRKADKKSARTSRRSKG